jgi:YVTN family beta-propeller protein
MNFKKITIACIATALSLVSCTNDDNESKSQGTYDKGVIILNEGGFGKGNAEISFLASDGLAAENKLFSLNNAGSLLGDTAQNFNANGSTAYVVMNGSNTIQVVERYSLKIITTITKDLKNPRYIVFANGKGYVTNWGDGGDATDDYIAVINLTTNLVESKIPVAEGPEKLIVYNSKLYVAHKGGYSSGNTLSVIDVATAKVISTIAVGDVPSDIEENQGVIYVLSQGKASWTGAESAGKIQKINPSINLVTTSFDFALTSHPGKMAIENNKIYYTQAKNVYAMNTTDTSLSTTAIFTGTFSPYGFAVHNNLIYTSDAGDYSSDGKVAIYDTTGNLKSTIKVGITPNGFYFNN